MLIQLRAEAIELAHGTKVRTSVVAAAFKTRAEEFAPKQHLQRLLDKVTRLLLADRAFWAPL